MPISISNEEILETIRRAVDVFVVRESESKE